METVLQTLHDAPPRYQEVPGTVPTADPCAVADEKALATTLGEERFVEPKGLHECDVRTGDGTSYPQVSVRFYGGLPEEGESADLGGGVTAVQVKDEDESVVSWDLDTATACEKAVEVAKSVVPAPG